MATITLRLAKGSPLTNAEIDANFTNMNAEVIGKLDASTYTATDILTKIKTVDGAGSGLDADLLGGIGPSATNAINTVVIRDASGNFSANVISANLVGNVTGNVNGSVSGTASNITGTVSVLNGGTGANSVSGAQSSLQVDPQGTALIMAIAIG